MHRVLIIFAAAASAWLPGSAGWTAPDEHVVAQPPPEHDPDVRPPPEAYRRKGDRVQPRPGALPAEELGIPEMYLEILPQRAQRLRELGRDHPEWFRRELHRAHRMARELEELKETNLGEFDKRVKLFKKEGEVEERAERLRNAKDDKEKEGLRKSLRGGLEALFDMKEAAQRDRVERMEQELKALRTRLDKRRQAREGIIDRHLRELEGGEDMDF